MYGPVLQPPTCTNRLKECTVHMPCVLRSNVLSLESAFTFNPSKYYYTFLLPSYLFIHSFTNWLNYLLITNFNSKCLPDAEVQALY